MKILVATCLALFSAASSSIAQTADVGRFRDPDGITADPTGLKRDTTVRRAFPRYPLDLFRTKITGASVVAFVIDTTGRVEPETATFLNVTRAEFVKAVCDLLPKLRFEPFLVGDQKMRVLLVQSYSFDNWQALDTTSIHAASSLAARKQEEFATKPIKDVVEELAPLPTCH